MLAKTNRAGEMRPWAIIMRSAPEKPQRVRERVAAMSKPMWATDE